MKKKILLFVTIVAVLACLFALSISAAEPSNSDEFGEVTILDHADIAKRDDFGYAEGDTARVVLQIPGTSTYVTYPMYYCFGVRNDGKYGMQPTPDFSAVKAATGYEFDITSVIRFEIPDYFTALSTNYTQTDKMANLKYVRLNKNFIYVHQNAFANLMALEEVVFVDDPSMDISLSIGSRAFAGSSIKSIKMSSQVTVIGERCFEGSSLETISFGSRVTATGVASFLDCKSLETVNVPENNAIVTVSHKSFQNCVALTGDITFANATFIDTYAFNKAAANEGTHLTLRFPAMVNIGTSGDNHIFTDSGVEKIYFGDKIAKMTLNNYNNCKRLTVIEIAGVAEGFSFPSYTFRNCTALQSFCIPEGVTSLPNRMFENCTSLGAVYLPSTLTAINSGSNDHATFKNCKSLYFVSEPFTSDNIPDEPLVYYFPSGLTVITDEAFDGSRINDIVVLPAGLTSLTQGFTFEGCTSASGTPSVVFMGDMTAVNVRTWGVSKIYFCNPADVDYASAGATTDSRMVFCYGAGNTSHIKELSKATDATCTLPKMTADYCFCGQYIVGSEQTEGIALGHNYTGAVSYVFDSLITDGKQCTVCVNGCGIDEEKVLGAVYTALGYSVKTFGTSYSFVSGYDVNVESLALYEQAKNVELKFGFAFNAASTFTEGDVTLDSFKIVAPVAGKAGDTVFSFYQYQMSYADDTNLDADIVIAAYVIEKSEGGEALTFINRADGAVNGFNPINYNKALELAK